MLKFKFELKSQLKQENNKKNNKENNKERRIKAENKYNDGTFIYSWKSETNSWIIGDTSRSNYAANAILAGSSSKCPDEIIIKGRFNPRENRGNNVGNNEVKEGPVEEVGRHAFNRCGYNSNTKKVVVPKEVKIIRAYGFYCMHKVTNFTIEIGSQLESIETWGLHYIGYNLDDRTDSNSFSPDLKNLILPHTLKSVSSSGIYCCNRFTRIIYCGNHNLNQNSCTLSDKGDYTKVYITPEYKAKNGNSIFKRAATGVLSEDEIDISCSGILPQPTPPPSVPPSKSPFPSKSPSPFPSKSPSPFPSKSPSPFPSKSPSPLPKWTITAGEGDGEVNVTGWESGSGERCPTGGIEIPERVNERTVVGVSERAFENCSVGGRISLARTVLKVGAGAFANTSDIESVLLPMGVGSVGEGAFKNCSGSRGDLSLVVPSSANIGDGAFEGSEFSVVVFAYDGDGDEEGDGG